MELCEHKLPTYFIDDANKIIDAQQIIRNNWKTKQSELVTNFLPDKTPLSILMTSGASCPDTVVEATIKKIVSLYELEAALEAVSAEWIS